MNLLTKLFLSSAICSAQSPDIKEINTKVKQETKQFWKDMFLPWENSGFTESMIQGGKKIFHASDYVRKTGNQMELWTVIGDKVYVELSPDWDENKINFDYLHWWGEHIRIVMSYGKMPKKIQFWTRSYPDKTRFEDYDGRRLDLLHPMMWFDNQPDQYNMIVHPDPYMMVGYVNQMKNGMCMGVNAQKFPWADKMKKVYFHGALTGEAYGPNGEFINRLKLMHMAEENPDYIYFGLSNALDVVKEQDIPAQHKNTLLFQEALCTRMDFKYMLTIDGNISPWGRGPQILYSDSVLMVVESSHQPLFQKSFVPWVHYVPIKQDLSDLISTIDWLIANDEKAKTIALNGNLLYKQLFDITNLVEDSGFIFQKYADMMKYEPEAPSEEFKYCGKWEFKSGSTKCLEKENDEEEGDFDEDQEDDEQEEKEDL